MKAPKKKIAPKNPFIVINPVLGGTERPSEIVEQILEFIAIKSDTPNEIISEIYRRGVLSITEQHLKIGPKEKWGLARVESFISNNASSQTLDADLFEKLDEARRSRTSPDVKELTKSVAKDLKALASNTEKPATGKRNAQAELERRRGKTKAKKSREYKEKAETPGTVEHEREKHTGAITSFLKGIADADKKEKTRGTDKQRTDAAYFRAKATYDSNASKALVPYKPDVKLLNPLEVEDIKHKLTHDYPRTAKKIGFVPGGNLKTDHLDAMRDHNPSLYLHLNDPESNPAPEKEMAQGFLSRLLSRKK